MCCLIDLDGEVSYCNFYFHQISAVDRLISNLSLHVAIFAPFSTFFREPLCLRLQLWLTTIGVWSELRSSQLVQLSAIPPYTTKSKTSGIFLISLDRNSGLISQNNHHRPQISKYQSIADDHKIMKWSSISIWYSSMQPCIVCFSTLAKAKLAITQLSMITLLQS